MQTLTRLAALPLLLATPALAHPGHLEQAAGHSHWLAFAAAGLALAVGVLGLVRVQARRKAPQARDA